MIPCRPSFSRGEQRIERNRLGRHALEVVLVVVPNVPQRREQHFMDRPVAAGQIDHKRTPDAGCDALVCKELHHVEQVARVLPIQRRNQLAAVDVLQRHHRNIQIRHQHVAGGWRERSATHRLHRAAHDEVDFDLDLNRATAHQQLRLSCCRRRRVRLESSLLQSLGGLPDSLVDARQRLVTRQPVIGKDQIEIDR